MHQRLKYKRGGTSYRKQMAHVLVRSAKLSTAADEPNIYKIFFPLQRGQYCYNALLDNTETTEVHDWHYLTYWNGPL
jgi:hypothetical protein